LRRWPQPSERPVNTDRYREDDQTAYQAADVVKYREFLPLPVRWQH
jgi:hypothetical protein